MSLEAGTRLGPYEVIAPIGVGGMGEVWSARDTRLGRDVALKILPDAFADDPDRLARFQREAHVLASLNHPNIAQIYGLEEATGTTALVMELVDGPTLADRIAQGPIPLDEALPIAKHIAYALEAAHEQGIIHRDLKPANIKVKNDGTVKVLDFGLAKALDPQAPWADITDSPTLTSPAMTQKGVILGTAAYMSPEQARGKPVDKRSDIWAFGCVLYEMLAGRPAFKGEDFSDTVATILRGEPEWSALSANTPPNLRLLLNRCLQKDRKQRLRDIGDAQLDLENLAGGSQARAALPAAKSRVYERVGWLAALAIVTAAWFLRAPSQFAESRLEVVAPQSTDATFALSPDGKRIVYVAPSAGQNLLWLRELAATVARPLKGTEAASLPFWSPDSQSIGFFAVSTGTGTLKRLDLSTGAVRTLAEATVAGAGWAQSNVILYRSPGALELARIPASGGEPPVAVTKLASGVTSHHTPHFLPDGRQFLFYSSGPESVRGVYLSSLDDSQATRLTDSDAPGRYIASGWLAYLQQGALLARRLDVRTRSLSGDAILIAESVMWSNEPMRRAGFAVSDQGVIAYRSGSPTRQLTWFDRNGKVLGTLGQADETLSSPELSLDGSRVVLHRISQGVVGSGLGADAGGGSGTGVDVWLIDDVRTRKLTFGSSNYPIWSPDGLSIGFLGARNGKRAEYVMRLDGADGEQILAEQPSTVAAFNALTSWSPDGRSLLFDVNNPNPDVWVLPLDGDRKPRPFLNGSHVERLAHFSPTNGHWVAYQSHESGRAEIYVRAFSGAGGGNQVSTAGGAQPRWRGDGKELYWISPDAKLMAASITVTGRSIDVGRPIALFQTRIYLGGSDQPQRGQYNVAPDGRFLINTVVSDDSVLPITIVQNWQPR